MLDPLKAHYRTLFSLDESLLVTNVLLDGAAVRVMIALEFIGDGAVCPEYSAFCSLKDRAAS